MSVVTWKDSVMQHEEMDTVQSQNNVYGRSPLDKTEAADLKDVNVCMGRCSGQVWKDAHQNEQRVCPGDGGFDQILKHFILFCGCWNYYKNAYYLKKIMKQEQYFNNKCQVGKEAGKGSDS